MMGKSSRCGRKPLKKNGIPKRTLYRYEKGYREEGFEGLRPAGRTKKRQQRLPENFEEIMEQAVQLKREVPKRSVRQIIKVLELEGFAAPGVLKQSTMQRHLYDAGLGKKQMKRYAEKRKTSSRRFCRPHRMELLQGDIKYGPDLRTTDGELVNPGESLCKAGDTACSCKTRCVPVKRQNRKIPPEGGPVHSGDPCGACAFCGGAEPEMEDFFRAGIPERGACRDKGVL